MWSRGNAWLTSHIERDDVVRRTPLLTSAECAYHRWGTVSSLSLWQHLHPEVPTRLILGGLHAAGVADVHVIPPVTVPSWLGGADGGAPPLLQRIFVDGSLSLLHGATYETPETIRMR